MSTPSERIFAQFEDGDSVELRDFLLAQAQHPMTLARAADRIAGGAALREAVADFVDDLRWARDADDVARRIRERSRDIEPRADAYLGALAEHVAAAHDVTAPAWVTEPGRFLSRIWCPRYPGLWARAIVEPPAAVRQRGIFLGAGMLSRVWSDAPRRHPASTRGAGGWTLPNAGWLPISTWSAGLPSLRRKGRRRREMWLRLVDRSRRHWH